MIPDVLRHSHGEARGRPRRVYLVASSAGSAEEVAAVAMAPLACLLDLGYKVVVQALGRPASGTVEELLDVVGFDLDTLETADYLVVLPGGEHAWEISIAPSLGVPVFPLSDFLGLIVAA